MDSDGIPPTATGCIWPDSAHIDDYPRDPDEGIDCDGIPPAPTRRPFEEALDEIVRMGPQWPIGMTPDAHRTHREAWAIVLRERYARRDAEEACCSDPTTPTAPAPTRQRA